MIVDIQFLQGIVHKAYKTDYQFGCQFVQFFHRNLMHVLSEDCALSFQHLM